ncbi:hypothetical protein GE061_009523 [Apolygus lucorum]|uniref:Amino acid permease/ SLC12A domain-containing protein n=1 Tax=Apolygus lucorum TaxID=248454 RepID=A0A8S9Y0G0_APOLU|nr:hypothetical protein GE061_009523 [Apolygus lucorum]
MSSIKSGSSDGIKLKKELGLIDGVGIIVGVIIGSGIFVSPKGVLMSAGSVGFGLIIWILSGLLSMIGALCYAELGTMIPKSGGDYAYINESFGPLPAFLYLWVGLLILVPTGNAITALTFAQYILQEMWTCTPALQYGAVRLLAALVTCLLTFINCYNVKWATRVQDIFTGTKILALVMIIASGIYMMFTTGFNVFSEKAMEGTRTEPGYVALAFYSGLFSYSGWNYLNFVTEELKDPYRNLPRAIIISLPLVTVIYVLTNLAYYVVLTKEEVLKSPAVAITFGDKVFGSMAWTIPFFVVCSTFGALNGAIFASSRLFFVGARQGHLPQAIALINVNYYTPVPSLIFLCVMSIVYLLIEDVYILIDYVSFVEALFTLMSVCGLLWLRYKNPQANRPIKVNIILPILFFVICIFLVTLPCYVRPMEVGIGLLIIISGIPVYYIFIEKRAPFLDRIGDKFTETCAKMFMCVLQERKDS